MAKRRNLNGIPHSLTKNFFGTNRYYNGGYMADWLANVARKLALGHVSLDVLTGTFTPEQLNIKPLVIHARKLKEIIDKELLANGFDLGFIIEAKIDFDFPKGEKRIIYCNPYMVDKDGKKYQPNQISEEAYEPEFDPFDENRIYPHIVPLKKKQTSFLDRLIKIFSVSS